MATTYLAPPYAPAPSNVGQPPRYGENTPPLPPEDAWLWRPETRAFSRVDRLQNERLHARLNGVYKARWATMAAALTILVVGAGVAGGVYRATRAVHA